MAVRNQAAAENYGIQPGDRVELRLPGGYQVLDKWLKDRKGRTLTAEDVKHYCRIATALAKTIEVQVETDKLYPRVEEVLAN